jgi:hypothetical protein
MVQYEAQYQNKSHHVITRKRLTDRRDRRNNFLLCTARMNDRRQMTMESISSFKYLGKIWMELNIGHPIRLLHIDYTPNHQHITTMSSSTCLKPVVFCGPSGVGKGTLIEKLMKHFPNDQFGFSVSHTTRSPRDGEVNGVHYNFTTVDAIKKDISDGKFIEYAEVHGKYYGTRFVSRKQDDPVDYCSVSAYTISLLSSIVSMGSNPYRIMERSVCSILISKASKRSKRAASSLCIYS